MNPMVYQKDWFQNLFIIVGFVAIASLFIGLLAESETMLSFFIIAYAIGLLMIALPFFPIKFLRKEKV